MSQESTTKRTRMYQLIRAGGGRWHLRAALVGQTLCGIRPRRPAYRATDRATEIDCRECLILGISAAGRSG